MSTPAERPEQYAEYDETTFREMDVEHLGNSATEEDLVRFTEACERRQARTGESDAEVTDAIWNGGLFDEAIAEEWYRNGKLHREGASPSGVA